MRVRNLRHPIAKEFYMIDIHEITDDTNEALREILPRIEALLRLSEKMATGYGVEADIESGDGTGRLRIRPFCWCDHRECPRCTANFDHGDGYSNHELLRLGPLFKEQDHVDGKGSPNFSLEVPEISVRIWWYKYIGRGMYADRHLTPEDAELIETHATALIDRCRGAVVRAAVKNRLAETFDEMSPATSDTLGAAFAALAERFENPVPWLEKISCAVDDIARLCRDANQVEKCQTLLDGAGVARSDDDTADPDFRMSHSLTYRLERLLDRKTSG